MEPIAHTQKSTLIKTNAKQTQDVINELPPPIAKSIRFEHNDNRIDHYHWMKNKEDPDFKDYLRHWNAYTNAYLEKIKPLSSRLYTEIMKRIQHKSKSVPCAIGKYHYYVRMKEGKDYAIYCRTLGETGPEEIVFDGNEEAKKHAYFDLISYSPSPDGRYVIMGFDTDGSQFGSIKIKDMESGRFSETVIPNSNGDVEWDFSSEGFYYVVLDSAKRPFQVFYHKIGTAASEDTRLFTELDPEYSISLDQDKLHRYLFINLQSKDSNELWYGPLDDVRSGLCMIKPRKDHFLYEIYPGDGVHVVAVTENQQNAKLMKIEGDNFSPENWEEFIPSREHVEIEAISHFKNYIVFVTREEGLLKLKVYDKTIDAWEIVGLPQEVGEVSLGWNQDYETDLLRFHFESPITPESTFQYNMKTKSLVLLKQLKAGNFNPEEYQAERIFAPAADGTSIPITLFYKKGLERDGSTPLHLYVYGAYSVTHDPHFSLASASFVERGVVCAIAHVRGGGYLGRKWYEEGKLLNKKNSFTDFINCAEHLIQQGFTSPEKLMINGGSAGGLIIAGAINMRPELFQVALASVPFVDVLTTMFDTSLPLTQEEWKEWGNPNDEDSYRAIKDYSPYDNVLSQNYPALMVTGGYNDAQVSIHEPAKWVAKLIDYKTDKNPLLFQINMGAGHLGASGRYKFLAEQTPRLAFLLSEVGIKI